MNDNIVYYENELEDEFSKAKITPIKIDEKYRYIHNRVWNVLSFLIQNIFSMPIKLIYGKFKFNIKYVGKEKFKECKNSGYFIYANHTQEFADTFIPSIANYPKRNFFIVNPENVSMKGLKSLVQMLGAIPIPGDIKSARKYKEVINKYIKSNYSITIYPEAHIWPYFTKIRPFKSVSFKYPVSLNVPIYTITNTYHKGKKEGKVNIISYIDGPFYPDKNLNINEAKEVLRNVAYDIMTKRAKNSTYEHIKYIKNELN